MALSAESPVVVELRPTPRTAEEWCARLQADDVTAADRAALAAWLEASPDNQAEYELCALVTGLARGLAAGPAGQESRPNVAARRTERVRPVLRRRLAAGAAALMVGAGLLAVWMTMPASYRTRVGQQRVITLADGSRIELNTASAITVDLGKTERKVVLRRGEAFFSVAPDRSRPFIVQAGTSVVRDIGTQFDVRVDGGGTSVNVLEGRVQVSRAEPVSPVAARASAVLLRAGQGAYVAREQPVVKLPVREVARATEWREGKIDFENAPLSRVIEEVNRYTEQQLVIDDPRAQSLTLSGVFRTGDTESVLFALREAYGLRARRDGNRIHLTAGRPDGVPVG